MDSKAEEITHLRQFLRLRGVIEYGEAPDMTLNLGEKRIAIEHTRLFRGEKPRKGKGSPECQRESTELQIVENAKRLYVAEKHYNLRLAVTFNKVEPIIGKPDSLAQQLCACVRELESTVIDSGYSGPFDYRANLELQNKIPDVICHIWIDKATYKNDLWSVNDGGYVGSIEPRMVQERLDEKEPKIAGYKKHCAEVWLLIVAPGTSMSSYFDRDNLSFLDTTYISSADNVFLLDAFKEHIDELQIQARQ